MTKKVTDYTQLTIACTIIAFVTAFILNALHIVSKETMYAVPVATSMTILMIIFLRENKFMKSNIADSALAYVVFLALGVCLAALFILEHYDSSVSYKIGDAAFVGIPTLSLIAGLFHTRYSIAVNAAVSLLLVYSGIQSVDHYLATIGMLSIATLLSLLIRFIFATRWSTLGKNKVSAF
ncbi:MAG TPA: hypothetical protein PK950_03020 [Candidatus Paceibacterota bacterium]|nr:hypothetical protein [Candidatus Paceibacterota bacterium]